MKRSYLIPQIRIQSIDTEDIMEGSLPIFNEENPQTTESDVITNKSDILGNSNSVWDDEEE